MTKTYHFTNKNGEAREITGVEVDPPKVWKAAARKATIILKYERDGKEAFRSVPRSRIVKVEA